MLKRYAMGLAMAAVLVGVPAMGHAAEPYRAQENAIQGVKVAVTPPDFLPTATDWDFAVSLQTHVRDLGDDLRESAHLIANGSRYAPVAWTGDPPGGHHRKGMLHFKAVVPRPASVELQIRLAGESAPRSFKWQLK